MGVLVWLLGGWVVDDYGGVCISLVSFGVMVLGVVGVLVSLSGLMCVLLFVGSFVLFFLVVGVVNGSIFCMVLLGFLCEVEVGSGLFYEVLVCGVVVFGLCLVIGVYGGFFIFKSFGSVILLSGGFEVVLYCFLVFYLSCMVICWWFYGCCNVVLFC